MGMIYSFCNKLETFTKVSSVGRHPPTLGTSVDRTDTCLPVHTTLTETTTTTITVTTGTHSDRPPQNTLKK